MKLRIFIVTWSLTKIRCWDVCWITISITCLAGNSRRVCCWSTVVCCCICDWVWWINVSIAYLLTRITVYLFNSCPFWWIIRVSNNSSANYSSNWVWGWITCCPRTRIRRISGCCSRYWCWRSWIWYTCWSRLILARHICSSVCSDHIWPLLRRISRRIKCIWRCPWLIIWSCWWVRAILTGYICYRLRVRIVRIISIWIWRRVWWSTIGYFSFAFSYMIKVLSIHHRFLTFLTSFCPRFALLLVILVSVSWDRHLTICTLDRFC